MKNRKEREIHEYISVVFSAPFIALYLLLRIATDKIVDSISALIILLLGLVIVPLAFPLFIAFRRGYEWDYPDRSTRIYPFSIVTIFYFITLILVVYLKCNNEIFFLVLSYFLNGLVVLIISLKYKISIHMAGIAGPATYLYLVGYRVDAAILYVIAFITAYSRYILGRHTPSQLITGFIMGVLMTYISYIVVFNP